MKPKITIYFIISFSILLLFLSSCEEIPIDYRNKYCGDWNFTTNYSSFNMLNNSSFDTIYHYKGEIWYDKRGEINIEYRDNKILEFQINKDGEITIDTYYTIDGKFSDENNVSFNIRTGGMGGGTREEVIGIKE